MTVPTNSKIYHIVHVDNLASIVADGCLWSDSVMIQRQGATVIGMGSIKRRRLGLAVTCHMNLNVGDCVPFYFCPRSIMLYVIHCANHPELAYRGGQQPIVHLEADLREVIEWAESCDRRWAFSTINAAHGAAEFYGRVDHFDQVNWEAVATRYWTGCRDQKQAEFLLQDSFPWHLVRRIGVYSQGIAQRASNAMLGAPHRPVLEVKGDWYY
ncbi:type II toxin-antitoxin system toxin DNA ADP-ribosyl transferase DarT [Bradyrhizobium sp. HKCCYLS1011]|uniref:type II toxin-antitoxin system toxin DNA ADP-ribosyl transferase DarT n=1 Tax=Bradyrhizobium sp. HKCCYLS1011 TaxID=3420733 RepID=UPI003EBE3D98